MLAVLALLGALGGVAHRFAPLVEAARFAAVAPASELRSKVGAPERGRNAGARAEALDRA